MKLLILGGTVFLGRHFVESALRAGHELTLFNRGRHGADLYPDIEKLRGGRDGGLDALRGRTWDAVVDTCGYEPQVVRQAATLLADSVGHYTFISSGSVYADTSQAGTDESAPVAQVGDAPDDQPGALYGANKALCEQEIQAVFGERAQHVRAGLIVGPHDQYDRFNYWVRRIAEGGRVLAPEPKSQPMQLIDARDLTEWVLRMAESGSGGTFNTTGPDQPMTMIELLTKLQHATASDAELVWASERFLLEHNVQPWTELPLWLAPESDPTTANFLALSVARAVEAGLTFRPLEQTARDTLTSVTTTEPIAKDYGVALNAKGLTREREAELFAALDASTRV